MIFDFLLSFFSVILWIIVLLFLFPTSKNNKKLFFGVVVSLFLGYLSTFMVLYINDILFHINSLKPKIPNILTSTIYISFIQAGMIEEMCKGLIALLFSYFVAFDKKLFQWKKEIVLISAFVGLGFAWVENFNYIQESSNKIELFVARTFHSSNIHLLLGLLFSLLILKGNYQKTIKKNFLRIVQSFLVCVFLHGLVDFFLIPASRIGLWLSTLLFIFIWAWVVKNYRLYILKN